MDSYQVGKDIASLSAAVNNLNTQLGMMQKVIAEMQEEISRLGRELIGRTAKS